MLNSNFLNLVALATLAIMGVNNGPVQVNAHALGAGNGHAARDLAGHHVAGHAGVARRKRDNASNSKRCKPRPSSSSAAPAPSSTDAAPTSSAAPAQDTPAPNNANNNNNNSGNNNSNNNSGSGWSKGAPGASTKLGLAWGASPDVLSNFKVSDNMPLINWSPDAPYNAKQLGFNFVPMLWGFKNDCTGGSGCFGNVQAADISYAAFVNEPNEPGQANMSPDAAIGLWWKYMQPLANQGVQTIGPVTSSNPNGLTWVKDFMNKCQGCTVNYMATHYYDTSAQGFIDYLNLWHNTFNKDIWITEYACQNYNGGAQCSQSEIDSFNGQMVGFINSTPWIKVYMPFGLIQGGLPDGVNQMNALIGGDGRPTGLAYQIGY